MDPSCVGLIMAGGLGSRMRRSGVLVPKPLVEVAGVTLLEHNLRALVRTGLREVAVSVSSAVPEVGEHVDTRLRSVAAAAGVVLRVLEETTPLGNIGAAAGLRGAGAPVLVTYADNLTTLDLARVVRRSEQTGADLTLAAHEEPFRVPYGELVLDGDEVVRYDEKPLKRVLVASAVCVLTQRALALLPPDRATGLSELFAHVRAAGGRVAALQHDAGWVDVNDAAALERAEALVAASPEHFDG